MSRESVIPSVGILKQQPAPTSLERDNLLGLFESTVGPFAQVVSLWSLAYYFQGEIRPPSVMLATLAFALSFPGRSRLQTSIAEVIADIALSWSVIAALMLATGFTTGYIMEFPREMVLTWLWMAPVAELATTMALRRLASAVSKLQGPLKRAVIVGMNEQGCALASRIVNAQYSRINLVGFVDDRSVNRLKPAKEHHLIGGLTDLASVVRSNRIQLIYLSLPMASQPRILQILDDLKDTTASIYFVPDMFVTDLIQGQPGSVYGMPVISVCETPFKGLNGAVKRLGDIVVSFLALLLALPALLTIALLIKLGSPGPVIFKQRRYGLDGKEILVYKFRSMTVTEDGTSIQQAELGDKRITTFGAFLRRTSLDELPQFLNVLQGRMSVVGPRPHAVAHNEQYRKVIKGYMIRHKVRPGITGWAQINGYRGETEILQKMQDRIDCDLDYLRHWSLKLDFHIIVKTIGLVIKDKKAY